MYILPTYLPNIKISEYATANQWFFFLDVTGKHILLLLKKVGGMSVPYTNYGVPISYMLLLLRGKGWASPGIKKIMNIKSCLHECVWHFILWFTFQWMWYCPKNGRGGPEAVCYHKAERYAWYKLYINTPINETFDSDK